MSEAEEWLIQDKNLSKTNCNISMPEAREIVDNNSRICNTCIKSDVCMLSNDFGKAVKDIEDISNRTGIFIDVNIRCTKWFKNVLIPRNLEITYQSTDKE